MLCKYTFFVCVLLLFVFMAHPNGNDDAKIYFIEMCVFCISARTHRNTIGIGAHHHHIIINRRRNAHGDAGLETDKCQRVFSRIYWLAWQRWHYYCKYALMFKYYGHFFFSGCGLFACVRYAFNMLDAPIKSATRALHRQINLIQLVRESAWECVRVRVYIYTFL